MTSILILLGLNGYLWWENPPRLSPDGKYYLERPWLRPYCMRFPFAWAAGLTKWEWISKLSILLTSLLLWQFHGLATSVLWLGLAATRVNTVFPILTDQVGILMLTLAWCLPAPWNIVFGLLGGLINEKVPVFSALITWNPFPLIGLAVPLYFYKKGLAPLDSDPIWLRKPFAEARKIHPSIDSLLLPWGVAAIGLLTTPISWVILSYAQLFIAQDRARLYQWIGPMVCAYAASALPVSLLLPLLVVHFLNPWRRVV